MKKLLSTLILFFGMFCLAQIPERMSYQAIIRDASGQLIKNQSVAVRVSVLYSGTAAYSERLTGVTNTNGLLNLEIGGGTPISGTFNTIDWSKGSYYLKTETDPTGGTNYTITGTSQLLSVPYAMYAKTSGGGGGITLPYSGSANTSGLTFVVTNNNSTGAALSGQAMGSGPGVVGYSNSGPGGYFDSSSGPALQTKGAVKIVDGTQGAGKVLTSDANGMASWQNTASVGWTANGSNIYNANPGNVGIGRPNPSEKLEVEGNAYVTNNIIVDGTLRINGGTPANGKVLMSNSVGLASWQNILHYPIMVKKINPQTFVPSAVPAIITFDDTTSGTGVVTNGDNYTTSKGGFYQFNVNVRLVNGGSGVFNGNVKVSLFKNDAPTQVYTLPGNGTTNVDMGTVSFSVMLNLQSGDVMDVRIENNTSNNVIVDGISGPLHTSFSAYLVN